MKIVLFVFIFLLICSSVSQAEYKFAQNWSWADTTLEGTFIVLAVIDWGQTRNLVQKGRTEINPLLGKHPSLDEVNILIPLGIVAHGLIAMSLKPVYHFEVFSYKFDIPARRWWQIGFIGIEGVAVWNNCNAGLIIEF
jgi:hypothetical protein